MVSKEIKTAQALKKYYQYVKARLCFIKLAIIKVSDAEFKRLNAVQGFYSREFTSNSGFKKWLLKNEHKPNVEFFNFAEQLKNKILEFEK